MHTENDIVKCPKCGKFGTLREYDSDSWMVIHGNDTGYGIPDNYCIATNTELKQQEETDALYLLAITLMLLELMAQERASFSAN